MLEKDTSVLKRGYRQFEEVNKRFGNVQADIRALVDQGGVLERTQNLMQEEATAKAERFERRFDLEMSRFQ